jgi:hypothetical protein
MALSWMTAAVMIVGVMMTWIMTWMIQHQQQQQHPRSSNKHSTQLLMQMALSWCRDARAGDKGLVSSTHVHYCVQRWQLTQVGMVQQNNIPSSKPDTGNLRVLLLVQTPYMPQTIMYIVQGKSAQEVSWLWKITC